jgi:hypothetical protein
MDSLTGASPRQLARIADALYLINIVCGAFAIGFVPATLFASDPATTAANIQAHELLYRSGLAAHVIVTVTNVPLALIFYELFKVVNRRVALLTAFFILVATAIEAAGLLNEFAPLVLLGNGSNTRALPAAQLQALTSLQGRLSDFLAPSLAAHLTPWIQLPPPLAEGAFALWLLVFGVNLERWTKRSEEVTRMWVGQVDAPP